MQKCVPGWIIDPTVGIEIWREQWPRVYEEGLFIIGFSDTYEFLVQGIVAYVPLSSLEIIPVKIAIKSFYRSFKRKVGKFLPGKGQSVGPGMIGCQIIQICYGIIRTGKFVCRDP